jgi:single-stranded DNA-binding protein
MGKFVGVVSGIAKNSKFYNGVAKFAVAYRQKENNEYVDKWVNVCLFGKAADRFKEYGGNDCFVTATGNVSLSTYTKNDGTTATNIELIAFDFDIIKRAAQPQAAPAQAPRPKPDRSHATRPDQPARQPTNAPPIDDYDDSDIPF